MNPGKYDFSVPWAGARSIRIRLKNAGGPIAIAASELHIWWNGGEITKTAPAAGLSIAGNQVEWNPSPEERKALPRGKVAEYSWSVNGEAYLEGRMEGVGSG